MSVCLVFAASVVAAGVVGVDDAFAVEDLDACPLLGLRGVDGLESFLLGVDLVFGVRLFLSLLGF